MKAQYVLGFMIDSYGFVAVIRKNKPAWQAGKLNGIGGKIEEGEHPLEAIVREFEEETGYESSTYDWENYAFAKNNNFDMHVFRCLVKNVADLELRTTTDEKIEIVHLSVMLNLDNYNVLPSARFFLNMAIEPNHKFSTVEYFDSVD